MTEFLIIAGLSGAGRSTAADTFEDMGWFVIDNLPPALIGKFADIVSLPGSEIQKVVLVIGTGAYLDELQPALAQLSKTKSRVQILFLDASDEVLVRRYEGTRRRHPLSEQGVVEAIASERSLLEKTKAQADVVIDTSDFNVHQLRDRLIELFGLHDVGSSMRTSIISFGYKHGIPLDVDLVLDCRFLPNPHWVEGLRDKSGLDPEVRDYVMSQPATEEFLSRLDGLLALLLPAYVKEGKSYLTIAVGCTGGHHRSVVLGEQIAELVQSHGFKPSITHRDIDR